MGGADIAHTLLIDGDILCYKAAALNQKEVDWGDDDVESTIDSSGAEDYMVSALAFYKRRLDAHDLVVCLTDRRNFRKELWPGYKAHRKDKVKPVLLGHCRKYLEDKFPCECWARLEADDVMGILFSCASSPVIVSSDKDMRSVPGALYNPEKDDAGIQYISPVDAFRAHMTQTLCGDAADGYKGCPGVGPEGAAKLLAPLFAAFPERCSATDMLFELNQRKEEIWNAVVELFVTKGSTAENALMQARLAYILQNPKEYDRETNKLKLWSPPTRLL